MWGKSLRFSTITLVDNLLISKLHAAAAANLAVITNALCWRAGISARCKQQCHK